MIDTDRMTEGAEVAAELRKKRGGGIPWMVILDGAGRAKITSDGPKGNCGCPAEPHEIDHFMSMLDATRRHMSDADRKIIERELRTYGKKLISSFKPGGGMKAYRDAAGKVRVGQFEAAVALMGQALEEGYGPEKIPTDPALRPLREDAERRLELFALAKKHVRTHRATLIDNHEEGRRIRLEGRVVDQKTGAPLSGAVMQLFHTDASGEYRPGMDAGGGAGNPRLWAFLRTDDAGRFTVDTIMPERYPNSSVPRHVHYKVWIKGRPEMASECFFDSDPNLDERTRASAPKNNFPIVKLERTDELRMIGTLTVRVPND
ncbi:MAG: hypothetical protein VX913_05310 [Planctomycetota bacterium]|nr:hypothetical protein [Planctomycetota bacterium]